MSAKKQFCAALLAISLSWGAVAAQTPYPAPVAPERIGPPATVGPNHLAPGPVETVHEGSTGLSSWITYERHNCCLGQGGGMPILTELFLRAGPNFPVGGTFFGRSLDAGWMIHGGGRAMFFDPSWMSAWAIDVGISNHHNSADGTHAFRLGTTNQVVTLDSYNRTFVNLGLGKEWYIWAPATSPDNNLRVGADFGGRYGSAIARFNEIRHRTDVIGGVYAAIHGDFEIPCGRCTFLMGLRGEWAHTWSDILEAQADLQDLSFLGNLGIRY